jgi:hypothetical protein
MDYRNTKCGRYCYKDLTATAIATGSAQDVAKATGTDAAGNPVGSDDTFTVNIVTGAAGNCCVCPAGSNIGDPCVYACCRSE